MQSQNKILEKLNYYGISFPRFTKLTINFAQYAKKGGIKLISITDKKTSPLYKMSDVCLFCPYESSVFLILMSQQWLY